MLNDGQKRSADAEPHYLAAELAVSLQEFLILSGSQSVRQILGEISA